ncbi:hypothetical protein QCA50_010788 [Cerrena zonata]|uniref:Zn(2)-C6 fungal-type domain-containing protein n=1 Tax=Cerrena zonata TaxID=2478898 RepID=A0AAW0FY37_9APHY
MSSSNSSQAIGRSDRPKKAKRLQIACIACRKEKRKCDGTGPCTHCYYGQRDCVYKDRKGVQVSAPVLPHPELRSIAEEVKSKERRNDTSLSGLRQSCVSHDVIWSVTNTQPAVCTPAAKGDYRVRVSHNAPYPTSSPHIRHKIT